MDGSMNSALEGGLIGAAVPLTGVIIALVSTLIKMHVNDALKERRIATLEAQQLETERMHVHMNEQMIINQAAIMQRLDELFQRVARMEGPHK